MATARRLGAQGSAVRAQFVDAAEAILSEVGYHGISARLVAARAGLKTQLLYYYFRTMDDVMLALVERVNVRRETRFAEAMAEAEPLAALWRMMTDPSSATLAAELSAMANHRPAIRDYIVESATQFRKKQVVSVAALLTRAGVDTDRFAPEGVVMMAAALARILVVESSLGLTEGHAAAQKIVDDLLAQWEVESQ